MLISFIAVLLYLFIFTLFFLIYLNFTILIRICVYYGYLELFFSPLNQHHYYTFPYIYVFPRIFNLNFLLLPYCSQFLFSFINTLCSPCHLLKVNNGLLIICSIVLSGPEFELLFAFSRRETFLHQKSCRAERNLHQYQAEEKPPWIRLHSSWRWRARWVPADQKSGAGRACSCGWQNGDRCSTQPSSKEGTAFIQKPTKVFLNNLPLKSHYCETNRRSNKQ